jgi:hypothetical protein
MAVSSVADFAQRSYFHSHPAAAPQSLGSASDNTLQFNPIATRVFVGSVDTLVVASSSGRQLLDIQNASGATTTAQAVSCNFGDRTATLYSGFTLFASSSKSFNLDNLYRGAIHCIAPANGALITVTDF